MIVKSQDGKLVVTLDAFPDRIFTEETLTHAVSKHLGASLDVGDTLKDPHAWMEWIRAVVAPDIRYLEKRINKLGCTE